MTRLINLYLTAALLILGQAGCQREAAPEAASSAAMESADGSTAPAPELTAPADQPNDVQSSVPKTIEMPPADAPTPALAEGAQIAYTCEDGSEVKVAYAGIAARITSPDGRAVSVSRTASKDGGDTYAGDGMTLHRLANVIELEQKGSTTRRCTESGGNA